MSAPEQSTSIAAPRWASSDDWDVYRGTITHLYEVEDMTLEKVINSMLNKHGFPRNMYKARFKRWGLQKNLRYEQVSQLLQQDQTDEPAPESTPQVLIEGRKVDPRRVKTYLRRTKRPGLKASSGTGRVAKMASSVSRLTPPPEPSIMSTPDAIRLPEECMWVLRDWVTASFQGGLWDTSGTVKNYEYTYQLIFWNNALSQIRTELQGGQTAQAFQKFGQCLDQYKQFLKDEDPRLFLRSRLLTSLADEGLIDRQTAIAKCHAVLRDIDKRPGLSWTSIYAGLQQTMAYFVKKRAQAAGASDQVPAALQRFAHLEQWYLYLAFKTSTDGTNRAGMMAAADKLTRIPMQDLDMRGRQAWMLADLEAQLRRLNISNAAKDVSRSYSRVLDEVLESEKAKAATSNLGKPALK
ncbi:hypothetical protein PG994_001831 [Apiospora phragmitis]|uniref:Clr5 domain-containing protein n=1 Tax=Apiospora phragmitis TaxID=2905665 RepID=A0ABR1WUM6_9PEZI